MLAASADPAIPAWIEGVLSPWMLGDFLGLAYWQWIGLLVVIAAGMVVDLIARSVLRAVVATVTARRSSEGEAAPHVRPMVRPVGVAAAGATWLLLLPLLALPAGALAIVESAIRVFITLAMIWAGFRGTDFLGGLLADRAARTENKLDDLLVPLMRKTLKAFIIAFGIIYLADSLDVELTPLIAGLGIGGLGFAFAAKDTIENFFGSVTVILDGPFQIGDWVVIGGVEGTVESVGMRSTRIRTFYDSMVTMPNSTIVSTKVDNYGRRRYRRWKETIGIGYDTPPERIASFCEGIRALLLAHPYTRKDYYQVWLHGFGSSSLDVLIYVFWTAPDWQTELRERHRLMLDIIRLAGELKVEFAFPTRTLYMRKEDTWQEGMDSLSADRPEGWMADAEEEGRRIVERFTANDDWRAGLPPPYTFTGARDGGEGGGEGGE